MNPSNQREAGAGIRLGSNHINNIIPLITLPIVVP